jgi:hypothetical protein
VSYDIIKLFCSKKPLRLDEFRDYFGTHLINNGILAAERNLVCGRIPISIFIRHDWSPKLKELGDRVLNATSKMEIVSQLNDNLLTWDNISSISKQEIQ